MTGTGSLYAASTWEAVWLLEKNGRKMPSLLRSATRIWRAYRTISASVVCVLGRRIPFVLLAKERIDNVEETKSERKKD